jgi:hypothetical protein
VRDLNDPEVRKAIYDEARRDAKESIERRRRYENRHKTTEIEAETAQKDAETSKIWHKIGFFVPISVFFIAMMVLCLGWV